MWEWEGMTKLMKMAIMMIEMMRVLALTPLCEPEDELLLALLLLLLLQFLLLD
jgi:hypothetical protein